MILAMLVSAALAQAKAPNPPQQELLLAAVVPQLKDGEGRPKIRIPFRKKAGKWEVIGGEENDEKISTNVRWRPCGGKVDVETRLAPNTAEDDMGWPAGIHQLAQKGAALPPGQTVLVSGGGCDDPDGWKRIKPEAVSESIAAAFKSESTKLAANLRLAAPNANPKSLRVVHAFQASDGRKLVAVAARHAPKAIGEGDKFYAPLLAEPIWISVDRDGAATALEIGGELLRAADFDGDGKSDLLLHFMFEGTDGYMLRTGGFAERTVWQYRH